MKRKVCVLALMFASVLCAQQNESVTAISGTYEFQTLQLPAISTVHWTRDHLEQIAQDLEISDVENRLDDIIDMSIVTPSPNFFFFVESGNAYINLCRMHYLNEFPYATDECGRIDLVSSSSDALVSPRGIDAWRQASGQPVQLLVSDHGMSRIALYAVTDVNEASLQSDVTDYNTLRQVSDVAKWQADGPYSRPFVCAISWDGTALVMYSYFGSNWEFTSSYGLAQSKVPAGAPVDDRCYFFGRAAAIVSQHDKVYVCDAVNHNILQFSESGPPNHHLIFEESYPLDPNISPVSMSGDHEGGLYIVDEGNEQIIKGTTRNPGGGFDGPLVILDQISGFAAPQGQSGELNQPIAVGIAPYLDDKIIYVTEKLDADGGAILGQVGGRIANVTAWVDATNSTMVHIRGTITGTCTNIYANRTRLETNEYQSSSISSELRAGESFDVTVSEGRPFGLYQLTVRWTTLACQQYLAECTSPEIPIVLRCGSLTPLTEAPTNIRCCSTPTDAQFLVCWNPIENVDVYQVVWYEEGGISQYQYCAFGPARIGTIGYATPIHVTARAERFGQLGPFSEESWIARTPQTAPSLTLENRTIGQLDIGIRGEGSINEINGFRIYYGTNPNQLESHYKDIIGVTGQWQSQSFVSSPVEITSHDQSWFFQAVGAVFKNSDYGLVAAGPRSEIIATCLRPTTSGTISWPERWFSAHDPQVTLNQDVTIGYNGLLTIDPGVTVIVNGDAGITVSSAGRLAAGAVATNSYVNITQVGVSPVHEAIITARGPVTFNRVNLSGGYYGLLAIATDVDILNSHIYDNQHNLVIVRCDSSRIENTTLDQAQGHGAVIVRSDYPKFDNCIISDNATTGIMVWNTSYTRLEDNLIENNGGDLPNLWRSGVRVLNGYVDFWCNTIRTNNGPGLAMLQGFSNLIGEGVPGSYPGARNALVNNCVNPDLVNMGQIFFEGTSVAAVDYGLNQISDSRSNSKLIKHPIYEPAEPDTSDTTYYMSWYRARANYWGTTDLTEISSRIEHPNVALLSPVLTAAVACPSIGGPTNPNETPSLSLLRQGWLLELAGSFEAAISRYDSIGKYYPTSKEVPAALVRISKCQNLNGLTWPAIRTYFRHMADTTSDPIIKMSARNTAAWCYVEMNQMDSARLEFQNVIDIATKNYDVVYNSLGKLMTELDEEDWGSITGVKAERDKASSLDEERDEQHALQVYSVKLANVLSRLDSILMNGAGAGDVLPAVPTEFRLYQNFPNPFNPNTEIRFDLPEAVKVQLKIFNVLGQEVATLVDELRPAGAYQILWDSQNSAGSVVSSGVYIYQIKAGNFIDSKKMVLLR